MILSILIPSTDDRYEMTLRLVDELFKQATGCYPELESNAYEVNDERIKDGSVDIYHVGDKIEIIIYFDNKQISVGEKRDRLYNMATGEFSVQWDSDDWISPDGIAKIMGALLESPETDCVTYKERVNIDGKIQASNFSRKYDDWADNQDGYDYVRTPFFKTPIRTSYCRHIGVGDERFGEDHIFARLIKPLLATEVHIDEEIYLYNHVSSEHNERYGIKE